ncbi:MAG: hypothetical protein IBX44_08925 [Sulfurospirillum sp.]|nr:hypothetical protein [Sulfurospirillum sp.]
MDNNKNLLACNNEKCIKNKECLRYELFIKGAKEFSTNGGNAQKGCGKFVFKK